MTASPENRSEPGFMENAAGALFWASAVVAIVAFIAGGEVDLIQDIPGIAGMLFFGKIWLGQHSARKGYEKEQHPVHHALKIGNEMVKQKIGRRPFR